MAEQVKSPEPGQYWEHVKSKDRAYFIGRAPDGEMVWQCEGDSVEHGDIDWSDWQHIPGCTGWDWEPETWPRYYVYIGDSTCQWIFLELSGYGLVPMVWRDGAYHQYHAKIERHEVESWIDRKIWKEISKAEAMKLKEPAETWPKFYVSNIHSFGYYRCDSEYEVLHIAPEGTEKQQSPASTLRNKAIWTEVTEAEAKSRVKPVESPDDWVVQDRVPARAGIDRGWWSSDDPPADKSYCWCVLENVGNGMMHGDQNDIGLILSVFCRRRDLPAVPEPAEEFPQYWTTLIEASGRIAHIKRIDENTIVSVHKDGTEVPDKVLVWNSNLRKRLTKEEAEALLTPEAETFPQWYILKEDERRSWVPDWTVKRTGEETSIRYARDEAGELYATEEPWCGSAGCWERCSAEEAFGRLGAAMLPEVAPAKKRFPIDLWVTYRVHDERGSWPVRATPAGEPCENWKRIQFDSNGAFVEVE